MSLLILAVSIAYFNSFRGVFQFDDYNVIVDNRTVHSWQTWFSGLREGIRPLLKFTYTLNWTSGAGLFGFHLVNISIHAVNVIMFYFLSLKIISSVMSKENAGRAALFASLLFALHPVQTEAVTYISGRSVSLMSTLYLASILLYLRGVGCEKMYVSIILLYLLSPLLFVMAALTKETAVTLPLALLLIERTLQHEKTWGDVIKKQAVHWVLFIGILLALIAHPKHGGLLEYSFDIRSMGNNILTQINGVSYLISRLIVLNGMNIDPDLPVITAWSKPLFIKTAFLIILLALGIITFRFKPLCGFGILWFFLHLTPTNSVVPRLDAANDRQLYLASFGIFLTIAAEAEMFLHLTKNIGMQRRTVSVAAILFFVLLGAFTIARNHDYQSEIALWEDTAAKSPLKARVYNNLGYAYFLAGRIDDAKKAYLTALGIQPDYEIASNNLRLIEK
ncbi:MAG: tetratricopeptide repeat protein [Nitrospirae bacterium]|nr:tetratricopeptide repeat protein [Nitrospirota bacterium]